MYIKRMEICNNHLENVANLELTSNKSKDF